MSINDLSKIKTSEKWHLEKYGSPEECYEYILHPDQTHSGRTRPELMAEIIKQRFSKLNPKVRRHVEKKWDGMVKRFPFYKSNEILDIGSPGYGDELLLRHCPNIEKIVCIDGDKDSIEYFRPLLNPKIELIYCNFYEENFPRLDRKFDTMIQMDFPEHVPDKLYEKVTKWGLEFLIPDGTLFLTTPVFPHSIYHKEHISVKSWEYFSDFFNRINMKVKLKASKGRIWLIVNREDKL